MMKQTFLFLFFSSIFLTNLQANNARALLPMESLWTDFDGAGYFFPNNSSQSNVAAIYAAGLWFGGISESQELRLSATTYGGFSGDSSYFPGVIDAATGIVDAETCANWDKHFQVFGTDISTFLSDWADGSLDGNIPLDLLGWPAVGNPHFYIRHGFELPQNQQLAPFIDVNQDGIYDPMDGDYPNTKGATQAIWWVMNTIGNSPNDSNTTPPALEVQMMAYAYAAADPAIHNTTFYDVTYMNRGTETLDSMFASLWIDSDLGCYTDDYLGCIPEDDLVFIYNEDAQDGNPDCFCDGGLFTYCDEIPVIGIKLLEGPQADRIIETDGSLSVPPLGSMLGDTTIRVGMSSFIYSVNGALGGAQTTPPPVFSGDYYAYMNGQYGYDLPILHDGEPTKYIYAGNPANAEDWTMCSAGEDGAQDRRFNLNTGPFRMLPGAVNSFSFCVTGVENVPHPCPDISVLQDAVDKVEVFWRQQLVSATHDVLVDDAKLSVFPNPVHTRVQLTLDDVMDEVQGFSLSGADGREVMPFYDLNGNQVTVQREGLASGIYIYQVITRSGKQYTGKLLFQ